MNRLSCLLAAALLAATPPPMPAPQITPQGEKLLVAARHTATVDGDLKGAIEAYRKIVEGSTGDRALAARALVEMAECHQKLGDDEAARIYARVVRDYADQADAVSIARAKLAGGASASASKSVTTRQVWSDPRVNFTGTVSADGRLLSFVDYTSGNLHLRELVTGRERPLTSDATWIENPVRFAQESAISPDGRLVAYTWTTGMQYELRVAPTSGDTAPRLLVADETIASIHPYAWSPDGRWIAAQFRRADNSSHIALVSAADGSLRVLRSGPTGSIRLYFSPDGAHLAFDLPSTANPRERDVFVLAVENGREIPAVVHPGTDFAAGWTPDGRYLLFASERSGSKGLWALAWTNGRPSGDPELLKSDMTMAAPPLGITRAGALYYGITLSRREVVVAGIDPQTGAVTAAPVRPIERFVGGNTAPDWSPDGRSLVYISSAQGPVLGVRDMETGRTRELRPAMNRMISPRWAPDGRSFAVIGRDTNNRYGIHRVDAQSGETSILVEIPQRYAPYSHDWTPDGRTLVYRILDEKGHAVVQYDLQSRSTRELMRGGIATMRLSPDGKHLAFAGAEGLGVFSLDGGDTRVVPAGLDWPMMLLAWTPDAHRLLVWKPSDGKDVPRAKGDLWLVSVEDGAKHRLDLDLAVAGAPGAKFNSKTNQLAITVDETRSDVWVLENFSPPAQRKGFRP
jgi:Tol biopolymer transport system component